jgi:hypothetical protein
MIELYMIKKITFYLIIFLLLPSCGYQKFTRNQVEKNIKQNVFIQMPKNPLVFENLSPILYKSLFMAYKRVGYNLFDKPKNSFVIKTKIKKLDPIEKFISPELLLYNEKIGIVVFVKLFDVNEKLIIQRSFNYSKLISYPKDPLQTSKFLDYEYKKLMDRLAIKIERSLRKYFLSRSLSSCTRSGVG